MGWPAARRIYAKARKLWGKLPVDTPKSDDEIGALQGDLGGARL